MHTLHCPTESEAKATAHRSAAAPPCGCRCRSMPRQQLGSPRPHDLTPKPKASKECNRRTAAALLRGCRCQWLPRHRLASAGCGRSPLQASVAGRRGPGGRSRDVSSEPAVALTLGKPTTPLVLGVWPKVRAAGALLLTCARPHALLLCPTRPNSARHCMHEARPCPCHVRERAGG